MSSIILPEITDNKIQEFLTRFLQDSSVDFPTGLLLWISEGFLLEWLQDFLWGFRRSISWYCLRKFSWCLLEFLWRLYKIFFLDMSVTILPVIAPDFPPDFFRNVSTDFSRNFIYNTKGNFSNDSFRNYSRIFFPLGISSNRNRYSFRNYVRNSCGNSSRYFYTDISYEIPSWISVGFRSVVS